MQIDIKRDNALKLHNTGQLREAKELFNQILENNPTDFVTLFYLANIAISAGDCIKALEYYDKSVLIRDDIAAVWHNRGCVLQHLERYADAVDSYDRALKIDPDNPGSSTNRDAVLEKLCQNVPLPDAVAPEAIRTTVNGADRTRNADNVIQIPVALDITVLGVGHQHAHARTGIYRYVDNILNLLVERPDIRLRLVAYANFLDACREFVRSRIHLNAMYDVEDFSTINSGELLHSPFYPLPILPRSGPRVLTVHDLIIIKFPQLFECAGGDSIRSAIASLGPEDFVTTVSEATKRDLCLYAPYLDPERVVVTPNAANHSVFYPCLDQKENERISEKYRLGPTGSYFLSVATLEPRKNIAHLVRSFTRLLLEDSIPDIKLVLVGTKGWKFEDIFAELSLAKEMRDKIVLTGFVPDEDMAALYSNAIAFAYPSLYEGFGIPPLEAMQCGTPVITSDNSSLPEVVGDAAICISASDENAMVTALRVLYRDKNLRHDLSQRGIARSTLFSWDRCVEQTVSTYKNAMELWQQKSNSIGTKPIIIDAVFFQRLNTGIARVWRSLLREWSGTDFGKRLIVVDRAHTAPRFDGLRYIDAPLHDYAYIDNDRVMLQRICDTENAALFISTYNTTPISTPSVFMCHDMIPELLPRHYDSNSPIWQEKNFAVGYASRFVTVSQNTANDLRRFFPKISTKHITVAHCGVDYKAPDNSAVTTFRKINGIDRPYFLVVGSRTGYKNTVLFFQAFAAFGTKRADYAIVCTGPRLQLESEFAPYVEGAAVYMLNLDDKDLQAAYAGALALVFPSLYEGFGLPIVEAMATGCPVITARGGAIPEVAGNAVIYVENTDVAGMTQALYTIQDPTVRARLISSGQERAKQFSWHKMAGEVRHMLEKTIREHDCRNVHQAKDTKSKNNKNRKKSRK